MNLSDTGDGLAVVFQHGLGADQAQCAEAFPRHAGLRRITLDCPARNARPFSIAGFAADVLDACDARGVHRFVAGGISMGAAIALHLAVRVPDRVLGLALVRPAWLWDAAPETMRPYAEVAAALRAHGPAAGRAAFAASATAAHLARAAPDNLASLLGFFDRPDPSFMADLLDDIARDGPAVTQAQATALRVPTLVVGQARDEVHPLALARALADAIPHATFAEVTQKGIDKARHLAELHDRLGAFLLGPATRTALQRTLG
jgi:pimeloyl-ACP methyl ester carboxylesterase